MKEFFVTLLFGAGVLLIMVGISYLIVTFTEELAIIVLCICVVSVIYIIGSIARGLV